MTSSDEGPSVLARTGGLIWRWRREAFGSLLLAVTAGLPMTVRPSRRWVWRWFAHARTRRLMALAFAETRVANTRGRMPGVRRVEATAFGERVHLRARPGHWAGLLEVRVDALAAAMRAGSVRVDRDRAAAHQITIDVVRRDPLEHVGDVAWSDAGRPQLSMWEPIHLGMSETGEPFRLSLVERGMLIGGLMGSGKSTMLTTIAAHAARSPGVHLALIDPNEVQFGPWRERATAYASKDPDAALAVLQTVADELERRTGVLRGLPGVVRKVTADIAAEHGLQPWLLMVDELAYHTSVVGTAGQRAVFGTLLRDIVSRGRAMGIITVAATQRPTSAVVPRDLADLFGLRLAFRTMNASNSDVILGDGMAKAGYNAAAISPEARGVGLLLGDDTKPVRLKGTWISDAMVADLSLMTIPLRPRPLAPAMPGAVDEEVVRDW